MFVLILVGRSVSSSSSESSFFFNLHSSIIESNTHLASCVCVCRMEMDEKQSSVHSLKETETSNPSNDQKKQRGSIISIALQIIKDLKPGVDVSHYKVYTILYTIYYTYTHMYTYIQTYTHTHTYTHMYTYIHTHTHTYIHTHMYTYIHTYIHTHTYVYVYRRQ